MFMCIALLYFESSRIKIETFDVSCGGYTSRPGDRTDGRLDLTTAPRHYHRTSPAFSIAPSICWFTKRSDLTRFGPLERSRYGLVVLTIPRFRTTV